MRNRLAGECGRVAADAWLFMLQTVFGTDATTTLRGYFPAGIAADMLTLDDEDSTVVTSLNTVLLGDDEHDDD